jgi:hypothetical protein
MSKRTRTIAPSQATDDEERLKKHAKWTKEQTELLISQLNVGEPIAQISKQFPKFTRQQIHSKISSLKQAGKVNPRTEGLAPSLQSGM